MPSSMVYMVASLALEMRTLPFWILAVRQQMHLETPPDWILRLHSVVTNPPILFRQIQRNLLRQVVDSTLREVLCLIPGELGWWDLVCYSWWALPLPLEMVQDPHWQLVRWQRGIPLL